MNLRDNPHEMDEPTQTRVNDRETFKHAGLFCMTKQPRGRGSWCGYVNVGDADLDTRWTAELDGDDLLDPDVDVYGGVTYAPDENGWVGFDDKHMTSLADARDVDCSSRIAVRAETERFAEQIAALIDE